MNKKELVTLIVKDTGLDTKDCKLVLESALSNIMKAVINVPLPYTENTGKIALTGFGTFEKFKQQPRTYRNPQTGEKIKVGEKVRIRFKAGKIFKEALQQKN